MNVPAGHRPLHALAGKFGIARAYHGVDGHHHQVPDDTLAAILSAIGIEAGSDSQAARTGENGVAADAAPGLPPVIRVREGEAPRLPQSGPTMAANWQLDLDDGTARSGVVSRDGGTGVLDECTDLPIGCHHLSLDSADTSAQTTLIVAPQSAWQISDIVRSGDPQNDMPRLWGITAPLYGLRSAEKSDGGIGTYADWGALAANARGWGADFAGANPVHALFPADPARCSPYSPSSRLFLNVMHIAPHRVPGFETCPAAQDLWNQCSGALDRLRQADLIDYSAIASRLFPVLQALYDHRPDKAPPDQTTDTALSRHALFEVLHEHFCRQLGSPAPWQDWPEAFRRPDSAAVAEFPRTHAGRIGFFSWLQQMADAQLADAAGSAKDAGAAIGLYADLAVGVARDGADVWARPENFAQGVSLGAPPDGFAPGGQNWALAPFNPLAIRAAGYAPFRAMLRATMRHAGLVRIDHVLGFARSFWIPDGLPGTYIAQPLDTLLDIVAIESRRARCAVIGEDLGNVPNGLRDTLADRGILGTRVAWFEREEGGRFRAAAHYP
ncbi:MAG: 4-alpha-glucanotransferase, partial [Alphaproteobacteria bacterium]